MKRWLADRDGSTHAGEIASVLECACKDRTPAVVLLRDTGDVLRARFDSIERSRVTLALDPSSRGMTPRPLSVCCITFAHDERAYVFLAPLWRVTCDPDDLGERLLSVGAPGQLATLDVSSARRIPIGVGVTLSIEVGTYDRRTWTPEAVDLSATGILLDFGDERPPRLPVGALVEIALEFEGLRAKLTAAVRRREGARIALSFVDTAKPDAEPPAAVAEIVAKIEQRWLESSAGV